MLWFFTLFCIIFEVKTAEVDEELSPRITNLTNLTHPVSPKLCIYKRNAIEEEKKKKKSCNQKIKPTKI